MRFKRKKSSIFAKNFGKDIDSKSLMFSDEYKFNLDSYIRD